MVSTRIFELCRIGCLDCRRRLAWLRSLVLIVAARVIRISTRPLRPVVKHFLQATLQRHPLKIGSRKTSSLSRFQRTPRQSCSVRLPVLTRWRSSVVRFVMMARGLVRASAMPSTLQTIRVWLTSGMVNTVTIRITSGSIRCSRLGLPSRHVSSVITL